MIAIERLRRDVGIVANDCNEDGNDDDSDKESGGGAILLCSRG